MGKPKKRDKERKGDTKSELIEKKRLGAVVDDELRS
jgi:hypothetical protein